MSKGKIFAMGGGFDGDDGWSLVEYIIKLSGKDSPNYLQIPTTGYDFADGGMIARFAKSGCEVDTLCLTQSWVTDAVIEEKISRADVLHVPGGNLEFVMRLWNRTACADCLRRAFDDGKLLFGSSSGSMCWFSQGFDDCGPRDSWTFVDGLGLIPYNNVPHYDSGFWQEFNGYADKTPLSTIACENEAAILYADGALSVVASDSKPDATAYFFDAKDGYKRSDLRGHPEILQKMSFHLLAHARRSDLRGRPELS